ncbi:DNA-directed DNA polymerase II small subunit [Halarchaeum sp. CBA1220]|uniref:DNA-directed DNA polymerase II small subunit n=1 Tax=Halarchaeum sp. CBA1220 TaxID=1853682 RepID=UPI000F3A8C49|nr:DNA-directed DNA polymerase II small subunit [Halarchaeum sp. CBA1220]QLC33379.1 DNA-directed DNA polymerase II small subunit [Halarchaeum sp. CBA1220]
MPDSTPVRVARELTARGYNADRAAVTLLADEPDPDAAVERVADAASDDALTLSADDVRALLDDANADDAPAATPPAEPPDTTTDGGAPADVSAAADASATPPAGSTPTDASSGATAGDESPTEAGSPDETRGGESASVGGRTPTPPAVAEDVTGHSTGTGEYGDFVTVFRDRYERLSKKLRGRINHRPTDALDAMPGGSDAAIVGMVNDIRSTASGHWLVELEDTNGTFPALIMKDRDWADVVDELLLDEVIAIEGTLADDGGILFADSVHFPDVPRTHRPNTADRHVQAALVSDVHVGSQEFAGERWDAFADWLHTPDAEAVEYLLVGGDMVEGVGVYPDQDEELDIVDVYDQYRAFSERLKDVPGDMEIVMIPGNHDAVRLAEPQPGFDEELREIMSAHDARIVGNPATVTVEGVDVLMYHGVSLDEVIAEDGDESVSYDAPHNAMARLLKKRHVAPQYGGRMRVAPEEKDYLVIDDVPDVFHTGHVHKLGVGEYRNVKLVNSGSWQEQTAFQKSVNIDPDVGTAPIVDLDTLDITVRKF